jgi:outer membrane protein assembly factor BamB
LLSFTPDDVAGTEGPSWNSPTVGAGRIYATYEGGALQAFKPTGEPAWVKEKTDQLFYLQTPQLAGGLLYCNASHNIVALQADSPQIEWAPDSAAIDGIVTGFAVEDGMVFVTWVPAGPDERSRVCAFRLNEPDKVWEWDSDQAPYYLTDPVVYQSMIIVADIMSEGQSFLYALSALSGDQIWRSEVPVDPTGTAVVGKPTAACGKVFMTTQGGHFYVFNASDGTLDWQTTIHPSDWDEWPLQPTVVCEKTPVLRPNVDEKDRDPLSLVWPKEIYRVLRLPYPSPELRTQAVQSLVKRMKPEAKRKALMRAKVLGVSTPEIEAMLSSQE